MFILSCDRDNSYCKVDDSEVIFDQDNPPEKGDNVVFFFNNEKETGLVIMKSDNTKQINKHFESLKKDSKKRKCQTSSSEKDDESFILPDKRPRRVNTKYSPSSSEKLGFMKQTNARKNEKGDLEEDNKKKGENTIQLSIEQEIIDKKGKFTIPKEIPSSPSKDELKKMLEEALKKIELSKNRNATRKLDKTHSPASQFTKSEQKKDNNVQDDSYTTTESDLDDSANKENLSLNASSENNDDSVDTIKIEFKGHNGTGEKNESEDPDLDDPDLYGKDWPGEKMVKLIDKVYCKESDLNPVKSMCSQASHVVRRLITGVFKPSGYLNATFSGQAPRAHTGLGKPAPVKSLNDVAKNEIIDYALKLAVEKKWKNKKGTLQTREELQRAMSQKIGELKRSHELSNKKLTPP